MLGTYLRTIDMNKEADKLNEKEETTCSYLKNRDGLTLT